MADKSPPQVAQAVIDAVKATIADYEQELVKMRQLEVSTLKKGLFGIPDATPSHKELEHQGHKHGRSVFDILGKTCLPTDKKSEDFIDTREDADPEKRFVHVGANDNKATDGGKSIPAPGSGGLKKDSMPMATKPVKPIKAPTVAAVKPAGVPGAKAGDAPKAPKTPMAPGAVGATVKSERNVFDILRKDFTNSTPWGGGGDGSDMAMAEGQCATTCPPPRNNGGDMAMAEKESDVKPGVCPKCKSSKDVTMTAKYPHKGTGAGGRGRLGDGPDVTSSHCKGCGHKWEFTHKSERNVFDILAKSVGAEKAAKIVESAYKSKPVVVKKSEPMDCPYCQKSLVSGCSC